VICILQIAISDEENTPFSPRDLWNTFGTIFAVNFEKSHAGVL